MLFHLPYSTFHIPILYFAYAANLNRSHMTRLCPGAEPLYAAVLEDYTLTVRQWFNVEPEKGAQVRGGVWRIEPVHLPDLDSYEDSPELYERRMMEINFGERGREEGDIHRLDWYEDSPGLYGRRMMEINLGERGREGEWGSGRNTGVGVSVCRGAGEIPKGHENQQNSVECLVYIMKEPFAIPLSPPDPDYLEMVRKGYEEWGISSEQLDAALKKAPGV